jgi:hypothetical protein
MTKKVLGTMVAGLLAATVIAMPYATLAQDAPKAGARVAAKAENAAEANSETKAKRPLTAHQLKMKECGAKWQEEKKAKGVKGLDAWNAFRSECMKS